MPSWTCLLLLLRNSDPPHFAQNSAAVVAPRGSGPTTARSLLRGSEALGFLGWVTNSGQEHYWVQRPLLQVPPGHSESE